MTAVNIASSTNLSAPTISDSMMIGRGLASIDAYSWLVAIGNLNVLANFPNLDYRLQMIKDISYAMLGAKDISYDLQATKDLTYNAKVGG